MHLNSWDALNHQLQANYIAQWRVRIPQDCEVSQSIIAFASWYMNA